MTQTNDEPQGRELSYFNLLTTGVGYLNQIKEVHPDSDDGMPFLLVKIAALRGKPNNIKKTYFTAIVSGAHAHEWINLVAADVAAERKVLLRFRLSDLEPRLIQDEEGNGGEFLSLRSRLIGVDWVRVDGKVVRPERRAV